jgi:CRP-like cAMP-binding protein
MTVAAPPTNVLLDVIDARRALGEAVEVRAGQVLHKAGSPEVDAYFPLSAVLSVMSTMANGDTCEVTLVGREGMVGLAGVLGASDSSTSCVVQVPGTCWRMSAASVRDARERHAAIRIGLDRYIRALLTQVAGLAACNRLHHIGGRLARWLLMLQVRTEREHFRLSQQTIASSLGVHRPTIALELQRLHKAGAIFYRSRIVKIVDRTRLESLTCECHETMLRDYLHMVRPFTQAALANEEDDEVRELVSHELCARLHAILGWCALAQLPDPPADALAVIERNVRAQLPLIQDLIGQQGRAS